MTPRARIIVFTEEKEQCRYSLEPGAYLVGRHPDCPVQVDAGGVSRRHARLTLREDGTLLIEDAGSSTGTWLDGAQLTAPTTIGPNQSIQVGTATLRIEPAMAEDHAEERPAFELSPHTRYELGPEIARGGMGGVYAAWQPAIHRKVALKAMLRGMGVRDRLRFIQEAQINGQLEHPNIVPVHGLALDQEGKPYYTMKLVRGRTLADILKLLAEGDAAARNKYPLSALLTLFQKVCDAIAFAHAKGILHRDLKPANIMAGDYGEVLVMDWGLAKTLGGTRSCAPPISAADQGRAGARPSEPAATLDGAVIGTPQYMSPEQARGEVEDLDGRSDIYALGEILFSILHLRPAYSGRNPGEVIEKVSRGAVEWRNARSERVSSSPAEGGASMETTKRARSARPTIPDSLAAICRKALAFDRDQRYWTVEELQADLDAFQNGFATGAENAGTWTHLKLLVARNKAIAVAAACTLLFIPGIAALFTSRQIEQRNRALAEEGRAMERGALAWAAEEENAAARPRALAEIQKLLKQKEDLLREGARLQPGGAAANSTAESAARQLDEARVAIIAAEELIHSIQFDARAELGKQDSALMEGLDQKIRGSDERHPSGKIAAERSRQPSGPPPQSPEMQKQFTPQMPQLMVPTVSATTSNVTALNVGAMVSTVSPSPSGMTMAIESASKAIGRGNGGMPGSMASRVGGAARAAAMQMNGGKRESEEAVMRGLRWLAKIQKPDGSWGSGGPTGAAMTGFSILSFLGHGETPVSGEFGPTMTKALDWVMTNGSKNEGRLSVEKTFSQAGCYAHGIATYALGEYYTMTKDERVIDLLKKAIGHIVAGQGRDGGWWMYSYDASTPSDTDISGWQIQALKAAHLTGLNIDGVDAALDKAMLNLTRVRGKNGGFGFRSPQEEVYCLSGVGVFCVYSWKQEKTDVVRAGIEYIMDHTKKDYPVEYKGDKADLYAWYYNTQACLLVGGAAWNTWNRLFQTELVKNQSPDGSWPPMAGKASFQVASNPTAAYPMFSQYQNTPEGNGPLYRTNLCILMLEVYYRYLPTTK